MSHWTTGAAEVELNIAENNLQRVVGGHAEGASWLQKADKHLATARSIQGDDPESAFLLAAEAAHSMGLGLLAQQGLRPTTAGGHIVVQRVLVAQFGDSFKDFDWIRRRRHEAKYVAFPGEVVTDLEIADALSDTDRMLSGARQLIGRLTNF